MKKVKILSFIMIVLLILQFFCPNLGLTAESQVTDEEGIETTVQATTLEMEKIEEIIQVGEQEKVNNEAVDEIKTKEPTETVDSTNIQTKEVNEDTREENEVKEKPEDQVETPSETTDVSSEDNEDQQTDQEETLEVSLMGIDTPGYYTTDPNAIVVPTQLVGESTNVHTKPHMLWANGDKVYVAVKATHELQYMTLNGVQNIDSDVYNPWISIFVDGTEYKPEDLTGNTKDSHWTVFEFHMADLNLNDDGVYPFFVKGIGGGHDVGGELLFEIPKTDVEAKKVWIGGTERPAIILQLMVQAGDGEKKVLRTGVVDGSETPVWLYKWIDVPEYDPYGRAYMFTADEETVPVNYEKSIEGLTVTNTYNSKTIDIDVNKEWIGPAAESVTFKLFADGLDTGKTLVLSEATEWSGSFTDLNEFNDTTGEKIIYTIKEVDIENYSMEKSGSVEDGFTFTNTNDTKTKVDVIKKWIGPKQDAVMVKLLANGEETGEELVLSEENGWSSSFSNLRKYDATNGVEIVYTVEEVEIPFGYEVEYSLGEDGGFVVTNIALLGSLTVIKVDEHGNRLAGAEFELRNKEGFTQKATTSVEGKIIFEDLEWGDYTLIETKAPKDYRLLVSEIHVTISKNNMDVEQIVKNTRQDWEIPKTGGIGTLGFYGVGLILMVVAVWFMLRRRQV